MCSGCLDTIRPGGERLIRGGLRVIAAFEHTGAAVTLVHHLKYRGLDDFAELVSEFLSQRVEPAPLVPVPRAWSRRFKYGVDPAQEIARRLGQRWEQPVLRAIARPVHTPRRAGHNYKSHVVPFRRAGPIPTAVYLVDDVVTTGATVGAAAQAIGSDHVKSVLAANLVPGVSSLFPT